MIEDIKYLSQRISESEKLANKKRWAKKMVDYICHQHLVISYYETRNSDNTTTVKNDYARMLSNYQLYNNVINQKDFERECNPLGLDVGQFKEEIHPYNKTYNKIQVLLGEELKRPFDYIVATLSEEGIRQKLIEKDESIRTHLGSIVDTITQYYTQMAQTQLDPNMDEAAKEQAQQQAQQQLQEAIDKAVSPETLEKAGSMTFTQKLEVVWSKILRYLTTAQNIMDKKNDAFKHGLIAGLEAIWVGIDQNEPCVKVLNPLGLIYDKSPDTKWIQDGNYAGYKTSMSINEIITQYGDDLSDEDLKKLEDRLNGSMLNSSSNPYENAAYNAESYFFGLPVNWSDVAAYGQSKPTHQVLNVYHVEWKSLRKVYFASFQNAFNETQIDIIDAEGFYIPDYAKRTTKMNRFGKGRRIIEFDGYTLEEKWIPDVWEGVRIGNDIYCRLGRKSYQSRNIDNPNDVKLGYHGVAYSNMNSSIVSLMDRMKPFQYLYFLIVHRLKELIAKDKGKVFHFDVSMVDPRLDLDKTLYYLEKLDIDFFNPLQNADTPGAAQRGKVTGTTDRSNVQHIANYVNLLQAIDAEISDVAGVTKQREGSASPYETATSNQNSIIQSSHITEIYFHTHAKLWEHVLNQLVQSAKECWKEKGIRKQYVLDDLSIHLLDVAPEDIRAVDMGVFVSNSRKDQEIFQKLERLVEFALSSGSAKISDVVSMYKANSIAELENNIRTLEKRNERQQQAQQQAELDAQKQMQEAQIAAEDRKMKHEKELKQMDIDASLIEAEIDSFKFVQDQDSNGDSIPDQLQIEKIKADTQVKNRQLDIEEKKMAQEKELTKEKLQVERIKAQKAKSSNSK